MTFFDGITSDYKIFYQAIGMAGFALHVYGFICLSAGRIDSQGSTYFLLKLVASAFVLISLVVDFNLSSALIQIFYIAIASGAVILRQSPAPAPAPVPVESTSADHRLRAQI